ncbi:helix-turn-helix domain-containing protein [Alishewanella sp. HL-SH06]|uniref:helix-turn-helix domain-containing protein n=1 Tax=Alishewanella sp. HL-SH06 TaxID=3461144 RepID=UPI0040434710
MIRRDPEWMHGGHILKANRKRIGLTQEQVVAMMDINLRTYQNWENQKSEPAFGMVMALCECVFKIELLDAITVAQEIQIDC